MAKSIANNSQANAMRTGGKKTTESKMIYLSMIRCKKVHFPPPALEDLIVLKVPPHTQHCQHHNDRHYHFKHCRDLSPPYGNNAALFTDPFYQCPIKLKKK